MTKISIITPIYNVEKHIRKCLDSIQKQTFKDFEVLCVDDFSTDNSIAIANEYAEKDDRFKIFKHETNRGVAAARNTALNNATGEYIVFVDADDFIEENELELIVQGFEDSKCDAVLFGFNVINNDGSVEQHAYQDNTILKISPENILDLKGCVWNKAFKTSTIKKHNITFPEGLMLEDAEFTFKAFTIIEQCYIIPEALYNFNTTSSQYITMHNFMYSRNKDCIEIFERIYNFTKEHKTFNKYKNSLLKWLGTIIETINATSENRLELLSRVDKLLDTIKFPENYNDINIKSIFFK